MGVCALEGPAGCSIALAALLLLRAATAGAHLSLGCKKSQVGSSDEVQGMEYIILGDYISVRCKYFFIKPKGVLADESAPAALLISFHGQSRTARLQADTHHFASLGRLHGFLSAYPHGMDDGSQGTGWNVGTAGDDSTCRAKGVGAEGDCYESCRAQRMCGKCNWSTCFNDVLFVKTLLAKVTSEYCVDLNRIYVHGESNGGMMAHYVVQELPDTFAAVIPWFGLPLLGYATGARSQMLRVPALLMQTAMLQLHDRSDTTIPIAGGESADFWLYESLHTMQSGWSALHGCDEADRAMHIPWHPGAKVVKCYEYPNCQTGRRVGKCFYDGQHGDYPQKDVGDNITVWFMTQFSRSAPAQFLPQQMATQVV